MNFNDLEEKEWKALIKVLNRLVPIKFKGKCLMELREMKAPNLAIVRQKLLIIWSYYGSK